MPDDLPYLRFKAPTEVKPATSRRGFPASKARGPSRSEQWERLEPALVQLQASLAQKAIEISASATGASAEDVLVIDLAHGVPEFIEAVQNTPGMEWLADAEDEIDVSEACGFVTLNSRKEPDSSKPVVASLYMIATNATALQQMLTAWRQKAAGNRLTDNLSHFGKILNHVIEIRRWDWRDRLPLDERHLWQSLLPEDTSPFRFEIELWFRGSSVLRDAADTRITEIIQSADGRILNRLVHEGCRYHGICVEIPANRVREFLEHPETSALLENESIYHLWLTGQAITKPGDGDEEGEQTEPMDVSLPMLEAEVALFDGMPIENHPLLRDRLIIHDPDGFGDDYPASERHHGTSMASIIVHGDLQTSGPPLSRRLYVRPVMRPGLSEQNERIPDNILPLDLIQRAVLQLVQEAPKVKVINLSIGDLARPCTGTMSAWARMLDWLQNEYNILFIVSAGNAEPCPSSFSTSIAFEAATAKELERDIMEAKWRAMRDFRILSPAESINALSIGATSADAGAPLDPPAGTRNPLISTELPAHASRITHRPGFQKVCETRFPESWGS